VKGRCNGGRPAPFFREDRMKHDEAFRNNAVARYLLDEMNPAGDGRIRGPLLRVPRLRSRTDRLFRIAGGVTGGVRFCRIANGAVAQMSQPDSEPCTSDNLSCKKVFLKRSSSYLHHTYLEACDKAGGSFRKSQRLVDFVSIETCPKIIHSFHGLANMMTRVFEAMGD
jgi:hypothetical protein